MRTQPLVRASACFLVLRVNIRTFAGNIRLSLLTFPLFPTVRSAILRLACSAVPDVMMHQIGTRGKCRQGERFLARCVRVRDYGRTDRGVETVPAEFWCESRPGDRSDRCESRPGDRFYENRQAYQSGAINPGPEPKSTGDCAASQASTA